ncbi:MAG: glycosyltransferase family 4 protein [Actinobacteria bacterium]|nr:MAG: glycosyltransferase family 4 protein [Actinomycetota bacterium]
MRLLHVIQEMRTGGAERVVCSLTRGTRDAGHDVAVASSGGELLDGLDVQHFPLPLLRRRATAVPRAVVALERARGRWKPDLVHCHNPGMALVVSPVTLRGRRMPALVSVHGVPEADWPPTARILRLAGLPAVACGPGVGAALEEHGVDVRATILNGVPPAPPPTPRSEVERELGLQPGSPLVLAVGRLVDAKNHALAVRAIAAVPGASLVIAGDGPLRAQLEHDARSAGVGDRVVLAGLRSDARRLMGSADAVVFSSRAEGLPLAALEALASGTPVVAAGVRGLCELLTDGEDSLIVSPDDASALAAGIRTVLDDPALREHIGAGGRRVAARYSEDRMVSAYIDLYHEMARR